MRQYLLIFLIVFAAVVIAVFVAPPVGTFGLADN